MVYLYCLLKLAVTMVHPMEANIHTFMSIVSQCSLDAVSEPMLLLHHAKPVSVHGPAVQ